MQIYGSLIIASSTGRNLFLYGLLALSVFCTYLGFIPSLGTPLCFHSTALDRVLGVFLPSFRDFDTNLQHHDKRWGKMTAREAFSERDFAWFASALTGFFLGFGYNLRNG